MKKSRKSYMIVIGILIALIVVSISMLVKVYNEKCGWQDRAANDNYSNWDHIYFMTTQVEKMGFTKQDVEEISLYVNGILYASEPDLWPRFSGPVTSAFLRHYYAGLALDIASSQLDDEQLRLAMELFKDATMDLKELSRAILDMAEAADARVQLLDRDSAICKQAEEMVLEYSEEYDERFSRFYSDLNPES